MIPFSFPNSPTNYKLKWVACLLVLVVFIVYGGVIFIYTSDNKKYTNQANTPKYYNSSVLNRHLYSIKSNDGVDSKISFNENYIGTWNRLQSDNSTSSISVSGNVHILFNLELTNDKEYQFNAKFLIYENSKAFINTFLFSIRDTSTKSLISSLSIVDNNIQYNFKGNIISLINDKRFFTLGMGNCTGNLTIVYNSLNDTIQGDLRTGNCSINLQYEVKIEDKEKKDKNISLYTSMLSLISISSIISQLAYSIQIEGNVQRSNSLCLLSIALNMIWTVYNIYSNFFLIYINIGYFYQFLVPMILILIHFGCDMKVWILSIETKYNNTRYISLLTFLALTFSFSSYFLGLGFYFEKNYIIVHMTLIWYPQIIYNVIYFNDSYFPISYLIVVTVYRTFIPLYFYTKEINFVDVHNEHNSDMRIYMGIVMSSLVVLLFQYAFGPRWFIPIKSYRENTDSLYKKRSEMRRLLPSANSIQCAICLNEILINKKCIIAQDFDCENEWKNSLNGTKTRNLNENNSMLFPFLFCFNKCFHHNKKDYMLTQCNHAFHSGCLELWLEFKKVCPNCRRQIKT